MTDERTVERVISHLRAQVAVLQQMEKAGTGTAAIEERKRAILGLQQELSEAVVDQLDAPRRPT